MGERMSYITPFRAEGHDHDCGAHYLEACNCVQGIVQTIKLAFAAELIRIEAGRRALSEGRDDG